MQETWALILVDTGPLVALFDPADPKHSHCSKVLKGIEEPLITTDPVLTESFHMLTPSSIGSQRLVEFILHGGMVVKHMNESSLNRAFELMEIYRDHPMDLADASLIVIAEQLKTNKVFTLDHNDFNTYKTKKGYRHCPVEIVI